MYVNPSPYNTIVAPYFLRALPRSAPEIEYGLPSVATRFVLLIMTYWVIDFDLTYMSIFGKHLSDIQDVHSFAISEANESVI